MIRSTSADQHDDIWYFAYGSNLSRARMGRRTDSEPASQAAFLKHYRLAFNVHADKAIYANIVPCEQSLVWGAAYRCSRAMMDALDAFEGVAIGCYRRLAVEVETQDGQRLQAEAYVGGEGFAGEEQWPDDWYLQLILDGAAEHGLPEHYIRFVAEKGARPKE